MNKDHITEIFSVYGAIKNVEMATDRFHPEFSRGFAYVEYENADDAEKAIKHMDGGMFLPLGNTLSLSLPSLIDG